MKVLKLMSWDDGWCDYIRGIDPILKMRGLELEIVAMAGLGIVSVMSQLKGKMTVYEAFLKGVEAVAGRESIKKSIKKLIAKAEKQRVKNAKSGFTDDALEDYIEALRRGLGENGAKEIKVKETKKVKEKGAKNRFRMDVVLSGVCLVFYTLSLLWVRFMDEMRAVFEANMGKGMDSRIACSVVSMIALIIVMGINYIMCASGQFDEKEYDEISNIEVTQSNRRIAIQERDMLLATFKTKSFSPTARCIIFSVEAVLCVIVFALLIIDMQLGIKVTGIVIDAQTIVMAYFFYKNNHYRFKIEKKLNVK